MIDLYISILNKWFSSYCFASLNIIEKNSALRNPNNRADTSNDLPTKPGKYKKKAFILFLSSWAVGFKRKAGLDF